jgi:hypothetical protein
MVCRGCGKESAEGFSFCPHCGMALVAASSAIESPSSPLEVGPVVNVATVEPGQKQGIATDRTNEIGTYVFGAFSVISLLVSIIKGIVPIYLVESAIWAGAAWYWHRKKSHSELAKTVMIVCAILVVIGEGIQIASQANSSSQPKPPSSVAGSASSDPWDKYATPIGGAAPSASTGALQDKPNPEPLPPCPSGIRAGANISEIAPDQVEGSDGQLWYVAPDRETGVKGEWYFHFTAINHAKAFCLTAIEYDVALESDNGAILKGHGKKHIDTLSPEWKYTPHQADPDDVVTFAVKASRGALSTWKITKAYGFPQTPSAPN